MRQLEEDFLQGLVIGQETIAINWKRAGLDYTIRKEFFAFRMRKHCNSLPREAAPSLEMF